MPAFSFLFWRRMMKLEEKDFSFDNVVLLDDQIMEIFQARKSGSYDADRILSVALVELQRQIKKDRARIEKEYGTELFECILCHGWVSLEK